MSTYKSDNSRSYIKSTLWLKLWKFWWQQSLKHLSTYPSCHHFVTVLSTIRTFGISQLFSCFYRFMEWFIRVIGCHQWIYCVHRVYFIPHQNSIWLIRVSLVTTFRHHLGIVWNTPGTCSYKGTKEGHMSLIHFQLVYLSCDGIDSSVIDYWILPLSNRSLGFDGGFIGNEKKSKP